MIMTRGTMDTTLNLHISSEERKRWNKAVQDIFNLTNGANEIPPGNGVKRGSSMNDFTNEYKRKLDGIEEGATRYVHPPTHPVTMIMGLHRVATSGDYNHLVNRPVKMIAEGGNCETINWIRFVIQNYPPSDPKINREFWVNPDDRLVRIFTPSGWQALHAVWA